MYMIPAKKIDEQTLNKFKTKECLIIDDFKIILMKNYSTR